MHYFIYPKRNATIYSLHETQNTGKDEILELNKTFVTESLNVTSSISRILLEFDKSYIQQTINNNSISNPTYYLNLKIADSKNVSQNNMIYVYAVSESWVEGIGKKDDSPRIIDGVSWKYTNGSITSSWATSGSTYISSSVVSQSIWPTQSLYDSNNNKFIYDTLDLKINVTSIMNNWINSVWNNYGFLIKRDTSEENDNNVYGNIQFYSLHTHTIYSPYIEVVWDDHIFSTGSLDEISSSNMVVYATSLEHEYHLNSRPQIRISAREKYPVKTYNTAYTFNATKIISSSYYSIEDAVTQETIIPFDDYTKVSSDDIGNYINLWFDGFSPERFYTLKIKYISGSVQNIYDCGTFKLIK